MALMSIGGRKGNWYDPDLFVSPLHPDCESRFRFYDDGRFKEYCVAVKQVLSRLVPPRLLNQGN